MIPSTLFCDACGAANKPQASFCRTCGNPLQAAGAANRNTATGRLLTNHLLKQRYRILDTVGQGGMGAVYKAEDTQLGNRKVAIKEMSQRGFSPQEVVEAADNFKQEAIMLARLQHPNLPNIYDHFSEAGRWYLVMSFIQGETLEDYLGKASGKKLPVGEVLNIGIQLCTVLSYLHTQQPPIIFRDLKPSNIMHTQDGHIYLIDFGIARHFKPGQARDTVAYGSAGYAAPEQYGKAQTTIRSDIYSLGAVLHQLLSGRDPSSTPFRLPPLQTLVPTLPSELSTLITQMLDDDQKRPASMTIVKKALERIADQQRRPPIPPTVPVSSPQSIPPTVPVSAPKPIPPTIIVSSPKPVSSFAPAPSPAPAKQSKGVTRRAVVGTIISMAVAGGIIALVASLASSPSSPSAPSVPDSIPTSPPTTPQPSYPNIQGTYSGSYQSSTSSSSTAMALDITQQNQQNFGGTCSLGSSNFSIQNGTVDTSGDIQFSIAAVDNANGNPVTVSFTGTAQSGGGWQGSSSDTDGNQGTWSMS